VSKEGRNVLSGGELGDSDAAVLALDDGLQSSGRVTIEGELEVRFPVGINIVLNHLGDEAMKNIESGEGT